MQFGDLRAPSALIEWTLVIKVQCRKVNRVKKIKRHHFPLVPHSFLEHHVDQSKVLEQESGNGKEKKTKTI